MNNKDFISELAQKTGYTNADAQKLVFQLIDVMSDSLTEGNVISIAGFGLFEVKKKLERVIVNPTTGQRMLVPPKLTLSFKPSPSWKEKVKNGGSK
jgi:nucleoid DNA-binding protein